MVSLVTTLICIPKSPHNFELSFGPSTGLCLAFLILLKSPKPGGCAVLTVRPCQPPGAGVGAKLLN